MDRDDRTAGPGGGVCPLPAGRRAGHRRRTGHRLGAVPARAYRRSQRACSRRADPRIGRGSERRAGDVPGRRRRAVLVRPGRLLLHRRLPRGVGGPRRRRADPRHEGSHPPIGPALRRDCHRRRQPPRAPRAGLPRRRRRHRFRPLRALAQRHARGRRTRPADPPRAHPGIAAAGHRRPPAPPAAGDDAPRPPGADLRGGARGTVRDRPWRPLRGACWRPLWRSPSHHRHRDARPRSRSSLPHPSEFRVGDAPRRGARSGSRGTELPALSARQRCHSPRPGTPGDQSLADDTGDRPCGDGQRRPDPGAGVGAIREKGDAGRLVRPGSGRACHPLRHGAARFGGPEHRLHRLLQPRSHAGDRDEWRLWALPARWPAPGPCPRF